jgi:hypothetical protein
MTSLLISDRLRHSTRVSSVAMVTGSLILRRIRDCALETVGDRLASGCSLVYIRQAIDKNEYLLSVVFDLL